MPNVSHLSWLIIFRTSINDPILPASAESHRSSLILYFVFNFFNKNFNFLNKKWNKYIFRMKISVLVSILASAAEAKKDKYFYCQTCAALVEESFFKVSQVGKYLYSNIALMSVKISWCTKIFRSQENNQYRVVKNWSKWGNEGKKEAVETIRNSFDRG